MLEKKSSVIDCFTVKCLFHFIGNKTSIQSDRTAVEKEELQDAIRTIHISSLFKDLETRMASFHFNIGKTDHKKGTNVTNSANTARASTQVHTWCKVIIGGFSGWRLGRASPYGPLHI